ncbi:PxxKW family cysteine-rich protein [Deltaproteobacteria bacterium OttesenSCG-928-K17]|nr:PxxKW family cysteine-rich protein [Deltaproteobacteria bacterium OttesenSCG-928-K17]
MTGTAINTLKVDRRPIIEQCNGCDRVLNENGSQLCASFAAPETKWRLGPCSMATHIKIESAKGGEKQRVGQQKQKKR